MSSTTKSGAVGREGAGEGGDGFFAASAPATASIGTMHREAAEQHGKRRCAVLWKGALAPKPAKAEPLFAGADE